MKKYKKYKDSGIDWLGEIPKHWKVTRMRYLCDIGTGGKDTENKEDNGLYPFYVRSQTVEHISSYSFDGEAILTAGDGVGVCKVWHYVNGKFDYHQRVYRMSDFNNILGKYLFFYLKENFVKEVMKLSAKSTVDSLRRPMFQNFKISYGSIDEQTQIANYLDNKTKQIDELIADKQKIIELLKEERTATINQAVTKGLNPNVLMKDSGIEWLGEIPVSWNSPKMKYICDFILDGTHGSFNRVDNGFRLLSVRNIINNKFVFRGDDSMVSKEDFESISKRFIVEKDDIQLAIVGATLGKVAIVEDLPERFVTQRSVATIRAKSDVCNPNFLFYFIQSETFQSYLWLNAGFSAQPGVYLGTLQNCTVPFPDIETQNSIEQYISKKIIDFDTITKNTLKQIILLKEYKTALISEVVTGKIDIRDEVLN